MGTLEQRPTTSSLEKTSTDDASGVNEVEEIDLGEVVEVPRQLPSTPNTPATSQKRCNTFEQELLKLLDKISSTAESVDDDQQFLMSLLPMLKKFDDDHKFTVRIKIMNAIQKIQREVSAQRVQPTAQPSHQEEASWYLPPNTPLSVSSADTSEAFDLGETFTPL